MQRPPPTPAQWTAVAQNVQGTGSEVTIFYKTETDQKLFFKVDGVDATLTPQSILSVAQQSLLSQARLDLSERDLSGYQLRGADFTHFTLLSTRLEGATLTGATFKNTSAQGSSFKNADLSHATFTESGLAQCNFNGANLTGDMFAGLNMRETDFRNANLTGTVFDHTALSLANFAGQKLANHVLRGCFLDGADLRQCDLTLADLAQTFWQNTAIDAGTILTGANLEGSIFTGMSLKGRDFHGANLRGVNFPASDLSGVNASGADLTLGWINSAGKLAGANLSGASMEAFVGAGSVAPGPEGIVSRTDLSNVNLRNANVQGAYLAIVNLQHADLAGADFSFADLAGSDLTGATGFDPEQPGIIFANTVLPDGSVRNGVNPGAPPAPVTPPEKLNFSINENGVSSQLNFTILAGITYRFTVEGSNIAGRFDYKPIPGGKAVVLGFYADSGFFPSSYTLLFSSPTSGKLFRNYNGSGNTGVYQIGTFSIP
jgi:uncharacterized protein YjbI with pentapeptide repeats